MTTNPPKIGNAPGLVWRKCKYGWQARWRGRADLVAKGYKPKNRARPHRKSRQYSLETATQLKLKRKQRGWA